MGNDCRLFRLSRANADDNADLKSSVTARRRLFAECGRAAIGVQDTLTVFQHCVCARMEGSRAYVRRRSVLLAGELTAAMFRHLNVISDYVKSPHFRGMDVQGGSGSAVGKSVLHLRRCMRDPVAIV